MRIHFWPDRAYKTLVGPAWPWISVLDGETYRRRVRSALDPYWQKRLSRVPSDVLRDTYVQHMADVRQAITSKTPGAAGYEKVEAGIEGVEAAFWFFDLGCSAWIVMLERLRREGWISEESDLSFDEVEAAWAAEGPQAAAELLDEALEERPASKPGLNLYRVPLALWNDHDPARAVTLLDRAVSRLTPFALSSAGITLPLSYGLALALNEQAEAAASLLHDQRVPGRPAGLTGFSTPEVRYQRARYLWDLREHEEALGLLRDVVLADPAYYLRLVTDRAWTAGQPDAAAALQQGLSDAVGSARSRVARWQQSRADEEARIPQVKRIDEIAEIGDDGPYLALVTNRLLTEAEVWKEENEDVDSAFWADLDRIEDVAAELPDEFPLRLGPGFAERFAGPGSDLEALEDLVDRGQVREAQQLLGKLFKEVPWAIRMGSISYAARLTNALATAGDVLRVRGTEADADRLGRVFELLQQCARLAEPIKNLPDRISPELLHSTRRIWEEIIRIEEAWIDSERRQFGRMTIEVPDAVPPIKRGGWRSYQPRVVDASGNPVAGVPVLWRVASGAGYPKDPAMCLDGEWALSLHTGTVHLTVEARGSGDGGVIEARILGNYSPVEIEYGIVDEALDG